MRNQIEDEKPHQESTRGKSSLVGPLPPAGDSLSGRIKQADGRIEGREFDSKLGSRSRTDRKSVVSGKSVSVRVDLGGRRIIKTNNNKSSTMHCHHDHRTHTR